MAEIEKLGKSLLDKVHEKLSGHKEIPMNQSHFECLHRETEIGIRKLKELFGVYKPRSMKSYEHTMTKLAIFLGYSDWNSFMRQEMIKTYYDRHKKGKEETIPIKKRVELDLKKDNRIIISVLVRG
jgi:hypothetical protein